MLKAKNGFRRLKACKQFPKLGAALDAHSAKALSKPNEQSLTKEHEMLAVTMVASVLCVAPGESGRSTPSTEDARRHPRDHLTETLPAPG
jgi:hypothetical protein